MESVFARPSPQETVRAIEESRPEAQAARTQGKVLDARTGTFKSPTDPTLVPADPSTRSPETPAALHNPEGRSDVVGYLPDSTGNVRVPGDTESNLTSDQRNVLQQSRQMIAAREAMLQKGAELGGKAGETLAAAFAPGSSTAKGVGRGVGQFIGGMAADPTTWALMGTGALEGAAGKLMSAGFGAQGVYGTYQDAQRLREVWNRKDIPYDEKVSIATDLVLNGLMAAAAGRHATRPGPVPLERALANEIYRLGDQAKADMFARLNQRAAQIEQQASAPSPQAQALVTFGQKTGDIPTPPAPPAAPPPKPPGPAHLTPELIRQSTERIAQLPEDQRGDAMSQAHKEMTAWMMQRQGQSFLGPDHKLHIVKTPEEAEKLALQFVNDEVARHDKVLAENARKAAQTQPAAEEQVKPQASVQTPQAQPAAGGVRPENRVPEAQIIGPPIGGLSRAELDSGAWALFGVDEFDKLSKTQQDAVVRAYSKTTVGQSLAAPEGRRTIATGKPGPPTIEVPPMGSGMTQDSPAVAKVHQEANITPGQEPLVMVKEETPSQSEKLAQPAAAVKPEDAAQIGKTDAESGRPILQLSTSPLENDRLAAEAAPELTEKLSALASQVPGAKFDRLRPQKNLDRVNEKVGHDKPPETIGDYLAAQIAADSPQAKDALIAQLQRNFKVINVEDKFLQGRPDKAGYPSANVQVQLSNGATAEVQIVPREVQEITDQSHRFYTEGREAATDAERERLWKQAEEINQGALQKFKQRNGLQEATSHFPTSNEEGKQEVDDLGFQPEQKFKKASTQINVPPDSELAKAHSAAVAAIPDEHVGPINGREDVPHLTLRYGLADDSPEAVTKIREAISRIPAFEVPIGKTETFPASEHSDGEVPVVARLKVTPGLDNLRKTVEGAGDFDKDNFPEYKPHITLAYVKPEFAEQYKSGNQLEGQRVPIREITVSKKDGSQEVIPLRQPAPDLVAIYEGRATSETGGMPVIKLPAEGNKITGQKTQGNAPEPGQVGTVPVSDLTFDPKRFQYKSGTNEQGVTSQFVGSRFNPELAGVVSVWRDPADGKLYTINGHHRAELAIRSGEQNLNVRHIVAKSAEEARTNGAIQNIADGRGTATDAGKLFRDTGMKPEDLEKKGIALTEGKISDGMALANLDKFLFDKVATGEVSEQRGIAIGEATSDPAQQEAIYKLIEKQENRGRKVTNDTVAELARFVSQSGNKTIEQGGLFGPRNEIHSLALEKAEISAYIKQQIAKEKRAFAAVATPERAEQLSRVEGQQIQAEKNKEISDAAAQAEELYNRLSSRAGPINGILEKAARDQASGNYRPEDIRKIAYQSVRGELQKALNGGEGPGARQPQGASQAESQTRKSKPSPSSLTDKEAEQYFTPGKIVPSYGGQDRVIAFHPSEGQDAKYPLNHWRVDVIAVDKDGKDIPGAHQRTHGTMPGKREIAEFRKQQALPGLEPHIEANNAKISRMPAEKGAGPSPSATPEGQQAGLHRVYHGTTARGAMKILKSGIQHGGIYLAETPEDAARYANAQATRNVDPDATTLGENGSAIVEFLSSEKPRWFDRSAATSLDKRETWINDKNLKVSRVIYSPNDYTAKLYDAGQRAGGSELSDLRPHEFLVQHPQVTVGKSFTVSDTTSGPQSGREPLPGMASHIEANKESAAATQGEELTKKLTEPPKSVSKKAGEMERESPLFRDTEASGQKGLFGNERGFAVPAAINPFTLAADAAKSVKDVITNSDWYQRRQQNKEFTRQARDLEENLVHLDRHYDAQVLKMMDIMKGAAGQTSVADQEAIYHHLEDSTQPLSAAQQQFLDTHIKPFLDANRAMYSELKQLNVPVPDEGYVHRVVQDRPSQLNRAMQSTGAQRGSGKGNLLSTSAASLKGRTMLALEDENGRRMVISSKDGKVTGFINGRARDMGESPNLQSQLIQGQGGQVKIKRQPNLQPGDEYTDGSGKTWNVNNATTREIEANTGIRYYKNALASTATNYLQLSRAVEAARFLEEFKGSPDFSHIAVELDGRSPIPKDWGLSKNPQFRGYAFEPRTREVLDDLYDKLTSTKDPGYLEKIGHMLQTTVLLNPLMHTANMADIWINDRGFARNVNVLGASDAGRAGMKALRAVMTRNADFVNALEKGAPLMSHRAAIQDLNKTFFETLTGQMEHDPTFRERVRKAFGLGVDDNPIDAIRRLSHDVAFVSNDIFYLQAVYERQRQGMSFGQAMRATNETFPEYRVPTRVLDSKVFADFLKNHFLNWFSAYHYGRWNAYRNMIKNALTGADPAARNRALSRMMMLGFMATVGYQAYDQMWKKITGDERAKSKRFGITSLPAELIEAYEGKRGVGSIIGSQITTSPFLRGLTEVQANKDSFTGRDIYDPRSPLPQQLKDIAEHEVETTIGPIAQWRRAQYSGTPWKDFALGQLGVTFPNSGGRSRGRRR